MLDTQTSVDADLKAAITAKIANLADGGLSTRRLADVFRSKGSEAQVGAFQAMGALGPSVLDGDFDQAAGGTDTLGALVAAAGPSAHELDGVRRIWRIVLGLEDRPSTHWALAAFEGAQHILLDANLMVACLLARASFITPEITKPVYDLLADSWMRGVASTHFHTVNWADHWDKPLEDVREALNVKPAALPDSATLDRLEALALEATEWSPGLDERLWGIVENVLENAGDAALITMNVAKMGECYSEDLFKATDRTLLEFDGVKEAMDRGLPAPIEIEDLKDKPLGTLGHGFYRLIKDNDFSVEVLDSSDFSEEMAAALPAVNFTSRRILQCHDLWHMTANYFVTPLHEISISGFQLGQFGQNYSASFLATIQFIGLFNQPLGLGMMSLLTFEGWQHGRTTPPLLLIDWHQQWDKTVEEVREEFGITPYQSMVDYRLVPNPAPVHHQAFDDFDKPIAVAAE